MTPPSPVWPRAFGLMPGRWRSALIFGPTRTSSTKKAASPCRFTGPPIRHRSDRVARSRWGVHSAAGGGRWSLGTSLSTRPTLSCWSTTPHLVEGMHQVVHLPEPRTSAVAEARGSANADSLRPHRGRYVGRLNGRVLVAAHSPNEVVEWLQRHGVQGAAVFRVPLDPTADPGGLTP